VGVQDVDAGRRDPHPLRRELTLRLGADDFDKALPHGPLGGGGVRAGARGEQARQLAAAVEPLLARVAERLPQAVDQRVENLVIHPGN
jgi:hypothetical protein